MVQHHGRHVIGIVPGNAGQAKADRGLRHVHVDDRGLCAKGWRDFRRVHHCGFCRQGAERLVDEGGQTRSVNGADSRDLQIVAGERGAMEVHQIVTRDSRNRVEIALGGAPVGMIAEGCDAESFRGQRIGVLRVVLVASHDLRAHALNGFGFKTRLANRHASQLKRCIHMARERLHLARKIIMALVERNLHRLVVERAVEGVGIIRPGAFVQQARQHMRHASAALGVLAGATLERKVERQHRHRVIFDQPGLKPERRDDFLHPRRIGGGGLCGG